MRTTPWIWLLVLVSTSCIAGSFDIDGVRFFYRAPSRASRTSRIMVLFGGRNWTGDKTLMVFHFDDLAERHNLFLLSPSFKNREYWEPEKWSGKTLQRAISALCRKYQLREGRVFFYGYSAGGQCSALFYNWMPEQVAAWGLHGCGVYPDRVCCAKAPALITCGVNDKERFQISRNFVYRYRETGGDLLWKPFLRNGHELNREALELAKAWFDALLSGDRALCYGEDETGQIGGNIDIEFRNPLYNKKIMELWKR